MAHGHGISSFVAQTLSENRDMLGVFLSSGFPVATSSEGGTVSVRFPIVPCDDYVEARRRRQSAAGGTSVDGVSDGPPGR